MSLKINELCVNCDVCEPACPNQAISMGETIYVIDPARCTECVGHFDEPQCVVVCPVECIDPDPEIVETEDQLLAKLRQLQHDHPNSTRSPIRMKTLIVRPLLLLGLLLSPIAWAGSPVRAERLMAPPLPAAMRWPPRPVSTSWPGRQRLRRSSGGVVHAGGGRADQFRSGRWRLLPAARCGHRKGRDAGRARDRAGRRDPAGLRQAGQPDRDRSVNGAWSAGIPGLPAALVELSGKHGRRRCRPRCSRPSASRAKASR